MAKTKLPGRAKTAPVPTNPNTIVRLNADLRERLLAYGQARGLSMSSTIRLLLTEALSDRGQ